MIIQIQSWIIYRNINHISSLLIYWESARKLEINMKKQNTDQLFESLFTGDVCLKLYALKLWLSKTVLVPEMYQNAG